MHSLKLEASYNTYCPQRCHVSCQYVQSDTLSPNICMATHSAALNSNGTSEAPLLPHEIEIVLRVLVTANTNLTSH